MTTKEWLASLKVGDKVLVDCRGRFSADVVEKITPKGFVKVNGSLFDNVSGELRGGNSWYFMRIIPYDAEKHQEICRRKYCNNVLEEIRNTTKITYDEAVAIGKILNIDEVKE